MSDLPHRRPKGSAIARVLEIIEAVAQAERPLSPADLVQQLDIPKPSTHRLLQQLQRDGFLQADLRGLLHPGARLQGIATGVFAAARHRAGRQAILRRLAQGVGETCGLAVPDGAEMRYHERVQSDWPLQLRLPPGSRVPLWCSASGKLYLSSLPPTQRQQIVQALPLTRLSRHTITDAEALERALQRTARDGLGVDDEEFVDGMVACAVAVRDPQQRLVACLYVHAPTVRKSLAQLRELEPQLREAAGRLEALLAQDEG
jgi:DNA-binding IclR family transcriptional regulator